MIKIPFWSTCMIQNQRHEYRAAKAFCEYIQNVDGLLAPTLEIYVCHSSMTKYLLARLVHMQHNKHILSRTNSIQGVFLSPYSRLLNQPLRASPYYDHCSITKAVIEPDGTVFLEYENKTDHLTNLWTCYPLYTSMICSQFKQIGISVSTLKIDGGCS